MLASIVIAAHNEGDNLWKTVQSCLETTEALDCEIVVADDASGDGSVDELRRRHSAVKIVDVPVRRGVSPTKDLAARSSRGDVLVFLDAHCKPENGAIARMVQDVLDWRGEAIVSPQVEELDTERWVSGDDHGGVGFWLELKWFQCGWLAEDEMEAVTGPGNRTFYRQPSMSGCVIAMARDLYEGLLGFDAGMLSYGYEDVDFGLKAWLRGVPALVDTEAVVGHRFAPEDGVYSIPLEHFELNQLRMARKNFGEAAWNDWMSRFRARFDPESWDQVWTLFEEGRESLERERDFLMERRTCDEFRYALEYDLAWPLAIAGSPLPALASTVEPRFGPRPGDDIQFAKKRTPPKTTRHGPKKTKPHAPKKALEEAPAAWTNSSSSIAVGA
jgi:GT2 family glycosyltransferase